MLIRGSWGFPALGVKHILHTNNSEKGKAVLLSEIFCSIRFEENTECTHQWKQSYNTVRITLKELMGSKANAEWVATAGKAASLLSQVHKEKNGLRKHGRVIKGTPLVTVLPVKWVLSAHSLWSQQQAAGCISPFSHELLGTSSQSSDWQWWLLKKNTLEATAKAGHIVVPISGKLCTWRTMEKNPPRIWI